MASQAKGKGLTAHYLYTFSVQQTVLAAGGGTSVFSRLRRTLARGAQAEPVHRILQLDVSQRRLNAILEESLKESYAAEDVDGSLAEGQIGNQLIASLKSGKTMGYDFQTVHDAQLFRSLLEELQSGNYAGIRIPRTVIKRGTLQRQERDGTYSDLFAVLVAQKLFLLTSQTASYPLAVLSLSEATPAYDELTRSITLQVGDRSHVLRGLTDADARDWGSKLELSCSQRYDVPSSSLYEPQDFAAVPSTSYSAEDWSDGSLLQLQASGREASLGHWGHLDQQGAHEASPANVNTPGWAPDAAEDFAASNWKQGGADVLGDATWKPDSADDFRASEWVPDAAGEFQPSEWTPDGAESFSPAEWQPESAEAFPPAEWRSKGDIDSGLLQNGAADDALTAPVRPANNWNGPVDFADTQCGGYRAPEGAESSRQQSAHQTIDYGEQGVAAQQQWKGCNTGLEAKQRAPRAEHEGSIFTVAPSQQQGGLQPRMSTAVQSPSGWGQQQGQLQRMSERKPSAQGVSTQRRTLMAGRQQNDLGAVDLHSQHVLVGREGQRANLKEAGLMPPAASVILLPAPKPDLQMRRHSVVKFVQPDREATFHGHADSEKGGGGAPEDMLAISSAALERGGEAQPEKAGSNAELRSPERGTPDKDVQAGNPVGRRKSSAAVTGRTSLVQPFSEVSSQNEAAFAADEPDSGEGLGSPLASADALRGKGLEAGIALQASQTARKAIQQSSPNSSTQANCLDPSTLVTLRPPGRLGSKPNQAPAVGSRSSGTEGGTGAFRRRPTFIATEMGLGTPAWLSQARDDGKDSLPPPRVAQNGPPAAQAADNPGEETEPFHGSGPVRPSLAVQPKLPAEPSVQGNSADTESISDGVVSQEAQEAGTEAATQPSRLPGARNLGSGGRESSFAATASAHAQSGEHVTAAQAAAVASSHASGGPAALQGGTVQGRQRLQDMLSRLAETAVEPKAAADTTLALVKSIQEIVSRAKLVLDSLGSVKDGHALAALKCADSIKGVTEASGHLAANGARRNGGAAAPVTQSGQRGSLHEPSAGSREKPSELWQGGNAGGRQGGSPLKAPKKAGKASGAHHRALRRLRALLVAELAGLRTDMQHLRGLMDDVMGLVGQNASKPAADRGRWSGRESPSPARSLSVLAEASGTAGQNDRLAGSEATLALRERTEEAAGAQVTARLGAGGSGGRNVAGGPESRAPGSGDTCSRQPVCAARRSTCGNDEASLLENRDQLRDACRDSLQPEMAAASRKRIVSVALAAGIQVEAAVAAALKSIGTSCLHPEQGEAVIETRMDGQSEAAPAHLSELQNENLLPLQSHREAESHGYQAAEHQGMGTHSERSIGGPASLFSDRSLKGRTVLPLVEKQQFSSAGRQTPPSRQGSRLGARNIEGSSVCERADDARGMQKGGSRSFSPKQVAGFRTISGEAKPPSGLARAASGSPSVWKQPSDLEKQALKLRESSRRLALRGPDHLPEAERHSSLVRDRQRVRTQASLKRLEASALVQAALALRREGSKGSENLGGAKFPRRVSSSSDSSMG